MRKDLRFVGGIAAKEYENTRHLEFGKPLPKAAPLTNPKEHIAKLVLQITEVISGVRSVEQTAPLLDSYVYEALKNRAIQKAQYRSSLGRKATLKPTKILRVWCQEPAEGVIESVVVLSDRDRARAVAVRLEEIYDSWRATSIGFL